MKLIILISFVLLLCLVYIGSICFVLYLLGAFDNQVSDLKINREYRVSNRQSKIQISNLLLKLF
jgi:hypothetical protein